MRGPGRISTYTEKMATIICDRLAAGESLHKMCKDKNLPNESTVYDWLYKNENFAVKYARARESQMETYLEAIMEIADGEDDPNSKRVRIDARKWAMSKLAPKKYGDKIDHQHSGGVIVEIVRLGE